MPGDTPAAVTAVEQAALSFWQKRFQFFKDHFLDVAFWLPGAFACGYLYRVMTGG